jgi:transcriptional regulator of aromatic amino acid metabolism
MGDPLHRTPNREAAPPPPAAEASAAPNLPERFIPVDLQRVGGQRQLRVDIRSVAATHRDLGAMVSEGRFRADLWYRINVFPVRLPALRERPQDIPAVGVHFALRAAARLGLPPRMPTPDDMDRLRLAGKRPRAVGRG